LNEVLDDDDSVVDRLDLSISIDEACHNEQRRSVLEIGQRSQSLVVRRDEHEADVVSTTENKIHRRRHNDHLEHLDE
jgi:hypothetical protein